MDIIDEKPEKKRCGHVYPTIIGYMWVKWAGEAGKKGSKDKEKFPMKAYVQCTKDATQVEIIPFYLGELRIENCEEHSYKARGLLPNAALKVKEQKPEQIVIDGCFSGE